MYAKIKLWIAYQVERTLIRKPPYRLLAVAFLIIAIALLAGLAAYLFSPAHDDFLSSIWWAFLRLTDPGYLGDDEDTVSRLISTPITILGYLLFLGMLIAIMTQWLDSIIARFERGESPIFRRNHVLILGYTSRTAAIVRQLILYEGRVQRFLESSGTSKLHIVLLVEHLSPDLVDEMKTRLGELWNENIITFRSGASSRPSHLERVNFSKASVIIIPGDDYGEASAIDKDTATIKTILTISQHPKLKSPGDLPPLVAELCDDDKVQLAKDAYRGHIEVLTSSSWISRLLVQNIRQPQLSFLARGLMTHDQGNELYLRNFAELDGQNFKKVSERFTKCVLLGVVRQGETEHSYNPILNPDPDFVIKAKDLLIVLAQSYKDATPQKFKKGSRTAPTKQYTLDEKRSLPRPYRQDKRKVLVLGWSNKCTALIKEFAGYEDEKFELHMCSVTPEEVREVAINNIRIPHENISITHYEADYSAECEFRKLQVAQFDNVVILGSGRMGSGEESDARALLGYLILQRITKEEQITPESMIELMDATNRALFKESNGEVFASPLAVSHLLAQVAIRPELGAVYEYLFGSGNTEIYFRPFSDYGISGSCTFAQVQQIAEQGADLALGFKFAYRKSEKKTPLVLNPERDKLFQVSDEDRIVVITNRDHVSVKQKVA